MWTGIQSIANECLFRPIVLQNGTFFLSFYARVLLYVHDSNSRTMNTKSMTEM